MEDPVQQGVQPHDVRMHEEPIVAPSEVPAATRDAPTVSQTTTLTDNAQKSLTNGDGLGTTEDSSPKDTTEVKPLPPLVEEDKTDHTRSDVEVNGTSTSVSTMTKDQGHVIFIDPVGTRWTFPYEESKTWSGVKKMVKAAFLDIYVPERYGEYLDEDAEGFSITTIKPEPSHILPSHWGSLVSPGWEFKIEWSYDILSAIRRQKAEKENQPEESSEDSSSDSDEEKKVEVVAVEETKKIIYVARYLVPDKDGDYGCDDIKQLHDKITIEKATDSPKSILEEHREVYSSDRHSRTAEANTIGNPILYIHSSSLLNALKAIIGFQSTPDEYTPKEWRAKPLTSDLGQGRFVYPFTDLHHYRKRLLEYREEVSEGHDEEYTTTCKEHIDILTEYLDDLPDISIPDAELLWSHGTPKTTFASLWLLLKAGSDVYVQEQGRLNAYVIESFKGGMKWSSISGRPEPYTVCVWNLNFDGQFLTRSVREVSIPVFDDERDITSLPLFPVQFHVDEDPEKPLRQQLVDRGRKFVEMVKKPTFQEYSGPSRLQGFRTFKQTRVVVDHTSQPWTLDEVHNERYAHTPITTVYEVELGQRTRIPRCPCKTCDANSPPQLGAQRRTFDDYDEIDLNSEVNLTDHQFFLCWSHVYGYVLKDRAWDVLDVSSLTEPIIHRDIIDTLVLKPESNKQMIKAVCEIFGGTYTQPFSTDFVQGRGEGEILLLHGPPGTGKTLTAESVAEYSGRPLLSITAADLGHEPELLEQNLLRFFRNAEKWNAIVLLDEADVYLEARSTQDLRRNSIVSIFLRALDYFQGLLFLTTNRVGSFDEAFLSRIHVQIGYDPLDEGSRRQIWDGYVKKLSRNHENGGQEIRCSYDAKEFIRRSEDLRNLRWNGREIRNAFQTAVALACFQAKQEGNRIPELTDEHLRQVVTMSHNFKAYMKDVCGDEKEMALVAGVRNDDFGASGVH